MMLAASTAGVSDGLSLFLVLETYLTCAQDAWKDVSFIYIYISLSLLPSAKVKFDRSVGGKVREKWHSFMGPSAGWGPFAALDPLHDSTGVHQSAVPSKLIWHHGMSLFIYIFLQLVVQQNVIFTTS